MTNELYMFRHGESQMNTNAHLIGGRSNETPLTQRGIEQSKQLGRYLLEHNILPTQVYASPAVRTLQTAEHTLAAMGLTLEPIIANELQELDQGEYVGRLRTEIYTPETLAEIGRQGKDFKLPGGESMNDVGIRKLKWVHDTIPITSESDNLRTFVFGHGVAIKTLASTLQDWPHSKTYESFVDNTSITLFINENGQWELESLGATPHIKN